MKTRLERRREKESLTQAGKYLLFTLIGIFLLFTFGLPGAVRLAGFLGELKSGNEPIEKNDTLPPAAPTLLVLPEATNSAVINIEGYAETGAAIKLNRGGLVVDETVAGEDGRFSFDRVALKPGNNEFFAEALDSEANTSAPSKTYLVTYDNQPPSLTIDQPVPAGRFFDRDSPITISGQTETDANVTVNGKFARVDSDGRFSLTWPLNSGDNQLDFLARDRAGNETKFSLTVNYTP